MDASAKVDFFVEQIQPTQDWRSHSSRPEFFRLKRDIVKSSVTYLSGPLGLGPRVLECWGLALPGQVLC